MGVNKKRWLAISMVLLLAWAAAGCGQTMNQQSTAEYIELGSVTGNGYRTAKAHIGDFKISFSTTAQVMCLKKESLYWEGSDDRYGELFVQQGQEVKKGDVLATFEIMSVSEADILERQLAIQNAEQSMSRTRTRYEESIAKKQASLQGLESYDYQIASLELEKLKTEYAQQMAQLEHQAASLRESLQELQERKEENQLIAPFDGRVQSVSRSFQAGNKVNAYEPLIVLEDTSSQAIYFINQSAFGNVPYLSTVELYDKWAKKGFTGTVVSCAGITGEKVDEIIVQPDDDSVVLSDITFLEVSGNLIEKKNVILVDSQAVHEEGSSSYVFVLTENNSIQKVYVSVGGISQEGAWITEGLKDGQTVILE